MGERIEEHSTACLHFRERVLEWTLYQLHMHAANRGEGFTLYPWVINFHSPKKQQVLMLRPQYAPLCDYIREIVLNIWYLKGVELRNEAESMQPPPDAPAEHIKRSPKQEKLQSPDKRSKAIKKPDSPSPSKNSKSFALILCRKAYCCQNHREQAVSQHRVRERREEPVRVRIGDPQAP